MKAENLQPPLAADDELAALITTLHATEQRLEELTGGQVDTVSDRFGRPYLLRRAQEELRDREAEKQAAILNALPAHIALLDGQGVIISVNETWRRFAAANFLPGPADGIGLNYLDVCDRVRGDEESDAHRTAAGIRAVLAGEKSFSIEYPCHSPMEQRWFLLTATPLSGALTHGVVVMHLNITARKLTENALRESQATMAAAQHIGHFGSWEVDLHEANAEETNTLRWSDEMFRIAGYEPGAVEVTNAFFYSRIPPEEHTAIRELVAGAIREHKPYSLVHRLIRADGSICFLQELAKIFYDEKTGRAVKIIGTAHDITERLHAETALRSSEREQRQLAGRLELETARFSEAQAVANVGSWETDLATLAVIWSDETYRIFEIAPPEFTPTHAAFMERVHPDDRVAVNRAFHRSLTHAEPCALEHRLLLPDGRIKFVEERWRPQFDTRGKATTVFGTCHDITERRRAEIALRDSNEKFHQLADNISDAFWIRSPDMSEVQYVSPAFEKIWGRSVESLRARPHEWSTFIHAEDRARVVAAFGDLTSTGPHLDVEYRIVRPDGELRWVHVRGAQIRNEADHLIRHIGIVTDITDRRRVAEALRATEAKYRALFENSSEGIFQNTPEGRLLSANPALARILGFASPEELIRERTDVERQGYVQPALREEFRRRLEERGFIQGFEYEVQRKDGTRIWVAENIRFVRATGDQAAFYEGSLQDITVRRQAETELQEKTAFLEAQVGSSLDGILVVDEHGKKSLQNRRLTDLFGIPPHIAEDQDDRPQLRWVAEATTHPRQFEEKVAYLNARPDEVSRDEIELKNGTTLDRYSAPVVGKEGKYYGRIWTFRDVTERKRSMEALRTSERRFKALFEQAAVGVSLAEVTTGRFVQVNQRFADILGRSRAELEQLTFVAITHPQDVALDVEKMRQVKAGLIREFSREKRYMRKDGSVVWASLTVSAMWAPGETPGLCVAVVQDITERKRLDEHFLQAQKMEALGQFSGGVAHDFNNILATISGYTELSRMLLQGNPEVRRHLESVLTASRRAADLVKQILTFSRQEAQERQTIRLQPVVEESIKLLRATIPSTIVFDSAIAADAPAVLGNANQIHQVLTNLGINAWHAMQDLPGRLQITLEKWRVDEAQAVAQPRLRAGNYARVSVSDTGCGMEAATVQRIFEPFFTTKPVGQGTGLGLAVVHGIMDGHDGAVTVSSQPGEGTVFHLYFPAHAGETTVDPVAAGATPRGRGEAVLVVDDEEMIAAMIQQTLLRLDYAAEYATDPAAALALVQADPAHFKLVLSDQTMPGMTGLGLAARLREIRPDLPVVLMTGFSASLTPERLEAAGVRQVLSKPLTVHVLGAALHAVLAVPPT